VNANLDVLTRNGNSAIKYLNDTGDKIIAGYNEIFNHRKIPAIVQGFGPMFQIYFTEKEEVLDFRDYCGHVDLEKYNRFANELRNHGVYIPVSNGLHQITCVAHNNDDIEKVLAGVDDVLKKL
jgi:glutamate-1-semialdehyde 2,1-aminomutase